MLRVYSGTILPIFVEIGSYLTKDKLALEFFETWHIRRHNMSMKSLQGRRTPGSRDECRTAPDGRRPLDEARGHEPLARL